MKRLINDGVHRSLPDLTDIVLNEPGSDSELAFSPDGALLASASSDPIVRLWNSTTGQARRRFKKTSMIKAISFIRNDRIFCTEQEADFVDDESVSHPHPRLGINEPKSMITIG